MSSLGIAQTAQFEENDFKEKNDNFSIIVKLGAEYERLKAIISTLSARYKDLELKYQQKEKELSFLKHENANDKDDSKSLNTDLINAKNYLENLQVKLIAYKRANEEKEIELQKILHNQEKGNGSLRSNDEGEYDQFSHNLHKNEKYYNYDINDDYRNY